MTPFATRITSNTWIRNGLWALAGPELHTLLTQTARWSRARYTTWLAETLARILLA
jgi:hypothetical protein